MSHLTRSLACVLCAALAGCALLGKNDPVVPRYFTPLDDEPRPAPAARVPLRLELRLGRVEAWSHLRERMVIRSAAQELVYSDERRWTERPEVYLRRGLSQTFFEERGLLEVHSGRAISLEVELAAFEEVPGPPDRVRLRAFYSLHDDRVGILQESVTLEQPVSLTSDGEHPRAVALAFAQVLRAGVLQIADRVVGRLDAPGPSVTPPK